MAWNLPGVWVLKPFIRNRILVTCEGGFLLMREESRSYVFVSLAA